MAFFCRLRNHCNASSSATTGRSIDQDRMLIEMSQEHNNNNNQINSRDEHTACARGYMAEVVEAVLHGDGDEHEDGADDGHRPRRRLRQLPRSRSPTCHDPIDPLVRLGVS
ncbi:Os06g0486150 [Oryza sativa Japonica Group]|uniref:Os06g0486150 protein n=1 Tax=Oryza sativa subsp. japonica TaxID=39947 RepID=A0A0N7KM50_ORYSJ|nr:Os06g0486150 [Oryza sativa Japonica Group]